MTTHDHDPSPDRGTSLSTDLGAGLGAGHQIYEHVTGPAKSYLFGAAGLKTGLPADPDTVGSDRFTCSDRYLGDDTADTDGGDDNGGGAGDARGSRMWWRDPCTEPLPVAGVGPTATPVMGPPLADLEREKDDRSGDRDGGPADNPVGDPVGDRGEDSHGGGAGAGVGTGADWGDRGPRVGIRAMAKARERRHARARDRRAADEGRLARMQAGARARLAGHSLGRPHRSYRPGGGVGGPAGCVRAADLRSEAADFAMLIRRTSAFEPTWRRRRNDVMCRETISDYQLALRLLALRVRGDVAMLGGHVGRPPYGYLTAPTGRSHPTSGHALMGLIADRQTAHVIPRVFAWRVELGLVPAAIARRLADDRVWAPPPIRSSGEVGSWTAAVVRGILANPRYTGRQLITLPVDGLRKLTPIVHSPLIDDQVFWRAHQPPPAGGAGSSGSEGEDGGRISAPPAGAVQDGHRWWNRDRWFFDHNGPRVID